MLRIARIPLQAAMPVRVTPAVVPTQTLRRAALCAARSLRCALESLKTLERQPHREDTHATTPSSRQQPRAAPPCSSHRGKRPSSNRDVRPCAGSRRTSSAARRRGRSNRRGGSLPKITGHLNRILSRRPLGAPRPSRG